MGYRFYRVLTEKGLRNIMAMDSAKAEAKISVMAEMRRRGLDPHQPYSPQPDKEMGTGYDRVWTVQKGTNRWH